MRKAVILGQKGGIGKTTCAVNLSVGLARAGKRVLLIDTDPQSNATDSLGVDLGTHEGLFELITSGPRMLERSMVQIEDRLQLIPASRNLAELDSWFATKPRPVDVLAKRLEGLSDLDFVILDTPPSVSKLSLNAIMVASEAWLPVSMEFYALQGVRHVIETLRALREECDHRIAVKYVFPTFHDSRNNKTEAITGTLRKNFEHRVTDPVRVSVKLSEAPSYRSSVFDYAASSSGAEDYQKIIARIINDGG